MTNNAVEFRGRFSRIQLHPGVVLIVPTVARTVQLALFAAALDEVDRDPDVVNMALDFVFEGPEMVRRRYPLP